MKIDKIAFYYPSKITGGTEYLFKRCSEYLAENQNEYTIYYIDYIDGFVRKNIQSNKVNFIFYEKGSTINLGDGFAIVAPLYLLPLNKTITYDREQSLALYWMVHQVNILCHIHSNNNFLISKRRRQLLGDYIKELSRIGVIKYMGYAAVFYIYEDLFQDAEEYEWLPNIINVSSKNNQAPSFEPLAKGCIKFCWLGRLDEEKSRNILTYMNELQDLSANVSLKLSLIGVGPEEETLKEKALLYSYPIEFVGEKRDKELDRYLREETSIGLASGTSALEFALRGKPVIVDWVIDRVYHADERKKYTFLYEDENIDTSAKDCIVRINEDSFRKKFESLMSDYVSVCKAEYEYAMTKRVDVCSERLIGSIVHLSNVDVSKVNYLEENIYKIYLIARIKAALIAIIHNPFLIFRKLYRLFHK